jgi:hypothetical protein
MSHLLFPRLHFRGTFSTNVGTGNNDGLDNVSYVDAARVRVDTLGKTDADFARWLREIEPDFGVRGGWNLYGDSGCQFTDVTCHSSEPAAGTLNTSTAADSVIGAKISLMRGIMVDQNPKGTTSTQIFAASFSLTAPGGLAIVGRPARAFSRWVAAKNLGLKDMRAGSAVWHSVIPPPLTIGPGNSPTLLAFKAALDAGQGLFIRYCTYFLAALKTDAQLAADFAAGIPTKNPAIGKVLGTIGVWQPGTMTTLAEGRRLGSGAAATINHVNVHCNPATVYIDSASGRISVDLINSVPEVDDTLEKPDLGPLDLTFTAADRATVLGTIANTRADYELRGGIADFDIPAAILPGIGDGRLDVIQRSTASALLTETPLVLETDDRAVYLQEGQAGTINLRGWLNGQPAAGQRVTILQLSETDGSSTPVPPATAIVACPDHVDLDANGRAAIALTAVAPGCCALRFAGAAEPATKEFFACVRVLPKDDFSAVPDDQITFEFIYENVLKYYHVLHPAMDVAITGFDLSVQDSVEQRADPIRTRINKTAWDDPQYMPRTRELSDGKKSLLLRWCNIVSPTG